VFDSKLPPKPPQSESSGSSPREDTDGQGPFTEVRPGERQMLTDEPGAGRPETMRRQATSTQRRVLIFTWIGILSMIVYGIFMVLSAFNPGYNFLDYLALAGLMFGLFFILLHGFGYANSMIKASWGYDETRRRAFTPQSAPKVVCIIASFNEPEEVLDETVAQLVNLDYPNKSIVILDDSTKDESRRSAQQIAAKYGVDVVQRTNRRGYKAGAVNDYLKQTDAVHVAIFDADALPAHNFLRDVIPIIEENPRLAFVQTPQYYSNTGISNVAMAASRQQAVFYEYICEGKSHSRAAFCCGTNVVFRRAALLDVGGFDESSVTEDFATSLNMHLKGYDSNYYNQVYVYSLAPETLSAYFTQQSRWAFGSVGSMRKVLGSLFKHGRSMRAGQWWEYFLSSSYYWIGWVNFIFMLLPMAYIFFGVQPLRQDVFTYLAIMVPYLLFTMNMFYMGMETRGYKLSEMLLGQQIGFISFPIHMSSAIAGILGRKRPFGVTPKGHGGRISWLSLWPQIVMLLLSVIAFLYGMWMYVTGLQRNNSAVVINAMWALYHVFLLSGIFVLNRAPMRRSEATPYFSDESQSATAAAQPQKSAAEDAPSIFSQADIGKVVPTTLTRKQRAAMAPPVRTTRPGFTGHMAMGVSIISLLMVAITGVTVANWYMKPSYPVNIYILDRTTGRDYQEHRSLTWTLNFLKLKKSPNFGPKTEDKEQSTAYNFASTFFGFIPQRPPASILNTQRDDLTAGGIDVPLPKRLETPGVVYLADTYGQFVEWDYGSDRYIHYLNEKRGISPDEVTRIEDFHRRKGLVIGEWNTIGYPTLPSEYIDNGGLADGIAQTKRGLAFLRREELPKREQALQRARLEGRQNSISIFEQQIADTREKIRQQQKSLDGLEEALKRGIPAQVQLRAQRRLEKVLKVHYLGWYGRYIDKFEEEREYDFRLWKNVQDHLRKRFPNDKSRQEPKGPGFVFYKDGEEKIYNEETKQMEENPFSKPVVLTQEDLQEVQTSRIARIYRTAADDPLMAGVADEVACRYWFDVVQPMAGADTLAEYRMLIKTPAAIRLKESGFPQQYLKTVNGGKQVVFPAAVAHRDGGKTGTLRSFYFAGDASDYPLVSRFAEMFPSTGGLMKATGSRVGPFSTQFYWNFYQPILSNILTNNKQIQYTKPAK